MAKYGLVVQRKGDEMLSSQEVKVVDLVWDQIWSSGITNPITVLDVIATLLMTYHSGGDDWETLNESAVSGNGREVAAVIAKVRREHGIEPGAEIEQREFWNDTSIVVSSVRSMMPILERSGDLIGDMFERVLSRLSTAGHFGQFRTPQHIVEMMVEIIAPCGGETVMDPACGTGGFLISASGYGRETLQRPEVVGIEIDRTIARIAQANMVLHNVEKSTIRIANGMIEETEKHPDVILANPPFAGSVEPRVSWHVGLNSAKTELLFTASMMRRLKPGGRAAVIVPTGVLSSNSNAARSVREMLLIDNYLECVIELPSHVFAPYTGVKTGILIWRNEDPRKRQTKMIRIENDGYSLDSRREPIELSDLQEAIEAFRGKPSRRMIEVSIDELREAGYNLMPSRYLPTADDSGVATLDLPTPEEILKEMRGLSGEIAGRLERMGRLLNG